MIDSYDKMTLGVYGRLMEITQEGGENADLAIIAALSGRSEDELLQMPLLEYGKLRDAAAFLAFQPAIPAMRDTYAVGAFTLIPCGDYRKLTAAQFIDYQEIVKHGADAVQLLSVLLVPQGHPYNTDYDVLEVQDAIREHLCVLDYFALIGFFQHRLADFLRSSLTCSIRQARRIQDRTRRKEALRMLRQGMRSVPSGDGPAASMQSLILPMRVLHLCTR